MSARMSTASKAGEMGSTGSSHSAPGMILGRSSAGSLLVLLVLLTVCSAGLAQRPSSVQPSSRVSANFQQAEALVEQGRFAEAKAKILVEIQRNPASVDNYNLLGIIESNLQDFPSAIAAFQNALRLAPNSTKTHNNLGNVYVSEKRLDLAEKEFQTVLRIDPANKDGNYNLGVLLLAKGQPAEAIPYFERVRPASLATRFNIIHAYFQSKRTAEALRMATELSAQNANDVQVHFSLGILLASEKQYKAAVLELEKADALRPGTFEILYDLGQAQLRCGDNAKAEVTLNRALEIEA